MPHQAQPGFDVAIVGGGVIGLAVAWRARQRGLCTVVLERGALGGGASHVAAGMLAPVAEARLAECALLRLGRASAARYPAFVDELAQASGSDPGYRACGTLVVARDRDEAEALERELAERRSLGLPVERLLASEARRREPALAPTLRLALAIPDDHAVDPRRLTAALAIAAERAGVAIREHAPVARVLLAGADGAGAAGAANGSASADRSTQATDPDDHVIGVELATGECIHAAHVVLAAGAWTNGIDGLPDHARIPLRPVKGQILRLRDPAGPGLLTHVMRMATGYLVPRGDGRYVLGATMEERGFDTDVTAGGVFELLRDASELVPGISELTIEACQAGLRPGTPDNAPAIGPGALAGLHWAAGHFRHGILLAPITADLLAADLAGEPLSPLAQPFAPARFAPSRAEAVAP